MALPQDTQFYQDSGADSGFKPADRRKFSFGQTGSPHEQTNPMVHVVGGMVLSGADVFDFASGAVTPFTFDHYGRLKTDTQLVISGGDIQIGAVELKDALTDTRGAIGIGSLAIAGSNALYVTDPNIKLDTVALSGLAVTRNAGIIALSGLAYTSDLNLGAVSGLAVTRNAGIIALSGLAYTSDLNLGAISGLAVSRNADLVAISGLNNSVISTDDTAMLSTPKILNVGGEYRVTDTAYADGDATVIQTARDGSLRVHGSTIPPYTHSSARGDFTATYTSTATLTIAGPPATVANQHLSAIKVTNSAGTAVRTFVNGLGGVVMSVAANVITIVGAGTPFAASDTYDVMLNLFDKATDTDLDSRKILTQNPDWSHYIVEQVLDLGSATAPSSTDISVDGYQNMSMQIEMGSPAGSLWLLASNDGTTFQNWTGSINNLNGLGNTAGSVFLTTSDFLEMKTSIDTWRITVSGAPTTTDVLTKRWY